MQINKWLIVVVALVLLTGCQKDENKALNTDIKVQEERDDTSEEESRRHIEEEAIDRSEDNDEDLFDAKFDVEDVPEYSGEPTVTINDNKPFFRGDEYEGSGFENYSELDELGRCGVAFSCITKEIMPTEERGTIGNITPSGWQLAKYDIIPDLFLFNRCHLIAYQLSGENDNEKNLITGTRYLNMEGMLPFENAVADYVNETGKPVLYRVTPYFKGDNLVASGVLMEGKSEDESINFCVYCYNVQPGIDINYLDGTSKVNADSEMQSLSIENDEDKNAGAFEYESNRDLGENIPKGTTYVFNTNTNKFHRVDCDSVGDMKPKNTEYFDGSREEAIERGYSPCGRCNP